MVLVHPAWQAWSTESGPELPAMETFENISLPGEKRQEKSGDSVNASSNVVQRLICNSFH